MIEFLILAAFVFVWYCLSIWCTSIFHFLKTKGLIPQKIIRFLYRKTINIFDFFRKIINKIIIFIYKIITSFFRNKFFKWLLFPFSFLWKQVRRVITFLFCKTSTQNQTITEKRNNHLIRKFLSNAVTAIIIFLIISLLQSSTDYMLDVEDASIDFILQNLQGVVPPNETDLPKSVFLNIDEQTYNQLGKPVLTPRKTLTNLIAAAVDGGAKLIIVDIELSQLIKLPSKSRVYEIAANWIINNEFYTFLSNYKTNYCQSKNKQCSILLFLRKIYREPCDEQDEQSDKECNRLVVNHALDKAVENSVPYIQWGLAEFTFSEYDRIIRRWHLWNVVCHNDNVRVIPSMQLLVAILVKQNYSLTALQDNLAEIRKQYIPQDYCKTGQLKPADNAKLAITDKYQIVLDERGEKRYIRYFVPWQEEQQSYLLPGSNLVKKISAKDYVHYDPKQYETDLATGKVGEREVFDNQIVIIGGSYTDARDIHYTPLGKMPGPIIIINSIYSLLIGQLETNWWVSLVAMVVIVLLISVFFTYFNSFFGMLFSGLLVIFLSAIISVILLYKFNILFNFIIPLVVIQFHEIAVGFNDLRQQANPEQKLLPCHCLLLRIVLVAILIGLIGYILLDFFI